MDVNERRHCGSSLLVHHGPWGGVTARPLIGGLASNCSPNHRHGRKLTSEIRSYHDGLLLILKATQYHDNYPVLAAALPAGLFRKHADAF